MVFEMLIYALMQPRCLEADTMLPLMLGHL